MKTLPNQSTHDLGLFVGKLSKDQHTNVVKWIEALRSGEYKQGKQRLHTDDGCHCCLGVAAIVCELAENWDICLRDTFSVMGLYTSDGTVKGIRDDITSLTALNDGYDNWSFLEIAGLIEDQMNIVGWEE